MTIEQKLEQIREEAERAAAANDQQKFAKLSQEHEDYAWLGAKVGFDKEHDTSYPLVKEQHLATCPVGSVDWADCCCGDAF